ncbi:hypothetical protein [Ferruginibacter sp. HRS2-29]|nr:hypothetical protein [Ferruginibacter sp. HRS2-29]
MIAQLKELISADKVTIINTIKRAERKVFTIGRQSQRAQTAAAIQVPLAA